MRVRWKTRFGRFKSMEMCIKTYAYNEMILKDYAISEYLFWELTQDTHNSYELTTVELIV